MFNSNTHIMLVHMCIYIYIYIHTFDIIHYTWVKQKRNWDQQTFLSVWHVYQQLLYRIIRHFHCSNTHQQLRQTQKGNKLKGWLHHPKAKELILVFNLKERNTRMNGLQWARIHQGGLADDGHSHSHSDSSLLWQATPVASKCRGVIHDTCTCN